MRQGQLGPSTKELHDIRHSGFLRFLSLVLLLESLADKQSLFRLDIKDTLLDAALHDEAPDRCGPSLPQAVTSIYGLIFYCWLCRLIPSQHIILQVDLGSLSPNAQNQVEEVSEREYTYRPPAVCQDHRICRNQIQTNATDGQTREHDPTLGIFLQIVNCSVALFWCHRSIDPGVLIASSSHLILNDTEKLGPEMRHVSMKICRTTGSRLTHHWLKMMIFDDASFLKVA